MDSIPEPTEISPLPESTWTGRTWWQVGCGGCCLLFVLVIAAFVLMGSWQAAGLPRDIFTFAKEIVNTIRQWIMPLFS